MGAGGSVEGSSRASAAPAPPSSSSGSQPRAAEEPEQEQRTQRAANADPEAALRAELRRLQLRREQAAAAAAEHAAAEPAPGSAASFSPEDLDCMAALADEALDRGLPLEKLQPDHYDPALLVSCWAAEGASAHSPFMPPLRGAPCLPPPVRRPRRCCWSSCPGWTPKSGRQRGGSAACLLAAAAAAWRALRRQKQPSLLRSCLPALLRTRQGRRAAQGPLSC